MMSTNWKARVALVFAALTLAACGGGGGNVTQTAKGYEVTEGVAQKGPLVRGSSVRINELSPSSFMPAGTAYDVATSDSLGGFRLKGITFGRQYLEVTASGYYFNELTGLPANDNITLHGLSDLSNDRLVNVNTLTELASGRVRALVTRTTNPLSFAAARAQAQREVLAAFYIYNSADLLPGGLDGSGGVIPGNFSELDISKGASANQILTALSAVAVSAGGNGVGISTFLTNFQTDLADDGLINNSPGVTVASQVARAPKTVNFGTVAANLNKFYKTTGYVGTNIGQWVDSSGGIDRVIDRYKYSGTGTATVESKSPAYAVGSDDVGQCFSVGSVNSGAAAALYLNGASTPVVGSVKVAAGDSLVMGLTAPAAGTVSGFIQRSAPVSGVCPTTLPTSGLVRVQKYTVTASGTGTVMVSTFAGTGAGGSADGAGATATFNQTASVALDASGNVYVTDQGNQKIRKITPAGVVSTFAGTGAAGSADGTVGTATFNYPNHVAFDKSGNLYVSDRLNNKIRKIDQAGVVSTLAGTGASGNTDGAGAAASFSNPCGIAVDASGNIYVADSANYKIRKITPAGVVSTLAGTGALGSADGAGSAATFNFPQGVAVDASGNVYVSDTVNNKIRKITPAGVVSTVAGTGTTGSADGVGATANFWNPSGIAVDATGNVYVADQFNNKVRMVTPAGVVSTVAGTGANGSADGPGATATFNTLNGVAVDASGNVYVADLYNNKIRKLTPQ